MLEGEEVYAVPCVFCGLKDIGPQNENATVESNQKLIEEGGLKDCWLVQWWVNSSTKGAGLVCPECASSFFEDCLSRPTLKLEFQHLRPTPMQA
jgi:hypothetical protein